MRKVGKNQVRANRLTVIGNAAIEPITEIHPRAIHNHIRNYCIANGITQFIDNPEMLVWAYGDPFVGPDLMEECGMQYSQADIEEMLACYADSVNASMAGASL